MPVASLGDPPKQPSPRVRKRRGGLGGRVVANKPLDDEVWEAIKEDIERTERWVAAWHRRYEAMEHLQKGCNLKTYSGFWRREWMSDWYQHIRERRAPLAKLCEDANYWIMTKLEAAMAKAEQTDADYCNCVCSHNSFREIAKEEAFRITKAQ